MKTIPLSAWVDELESGARPKGGIKDGVGEVPSLGAEHLADDGGFNFAKDKRIPYDFFRSMKKGRIKSDDILIVKDGATTGKVSFVNGDFPYDEAAINEHVFRLGVSRKKADPRFVFRYLQSPLGQEQIMSDFRGATVGGIGRTFLDKVFLPDIGLSEQRRIAAILDKADATRRKREQAPALADDFLKSMFLGMFGDPVANANGFSVTTIEALCELITDCLHTTPNHFDEPNQYPSIRSSELQGGYIDLSSAKYVSEAEYKVRIQRYRPAPSDSIYCREGARFGSVGIIPEGMTPCLGQRTMLLRADRRVATPEYLWSVLRSDAVFQQASNVVGGAASPHVNIKDIRKFKSLMPPLDLQKTFSKACQRVFSLRERLASQAREAKNLFSVLSQRAFRGEL